ncbi:AAA family ATPase [Micromonospora harpali]|uniref:ATP-binding protein n=1 Tax=Micromonospora harpali TaxID=1490225 RepID=UPI0033902650
MPFIDNTAAMPRRRELDQLRTVFDLAGAGTAWAFVRGDPGSGKTWLLNAVAEEAAGEGFLVLRGRGSEYERHVPFSLLVHALDDYLDGLGGDLLAGLGDNRVADLARVFPSLSGRDQTCPQAAQDNNYRAHRAIRALVERLAEPSGLVLVLDDLQWADRESVAFLAHLLERQPKGRLLLLAAWRSGPCEGPLVGLCLCTEQPGVAVELEPLPDREAETFLTAVRGPRRRAELLRLCGGNPCYLRALAEQGGGRPVDRLPDRIVTVLRWELGRLSEPARHLLTSAAIVGETFHLELVRAVNGTTDEQTLLAADELVSSGLIRETDVPREFAFRQPIVRHGVYQLASPGRRVSGHRRAAEALRGASARRRAVHLAAFATPPDPEAAATLTEAARETMDVDPARSAEWFRTARVLERDPVARHEALLGQGDAAAAAGLLQQARAAYDRAWSHEPGRRPDGRLELARRLAMVEFLTGHHTRTRERVRALRAEADSADAEAVALLSALGACAAAQAGDSAELRRLAAESLRHARTPPARALANGLVGLGQLQQHAMNQALAARVAARRELTLVCDRELPAHPEALLVPALLELLMGGYAEAIVLVDRLLSHRRPAPAAWWRAPALWIAARARLALGEPAEAAELVEAAVELAEDGQARAVLPWALLTAAELRTLADDDDGAVRLALEAVAATGDDDTSRPLAEQWATIVRIDVGDVVADLETVVALRRVAPVDPVSDGAWRCCAAAAALGENRFDEADEQARAAEDVARATGLPMATVHARRARAMVHLARREAAAAAESARAAARSAAAAGARVEAARDMLTEAAALALGGNRAGAATVLRVALDEFRDCGAVRYEREAARELRRLGRRTPLGPVPTVADQRLPLSDREWQIAELVAAGRTNRQIAATLLLSAKTVETHLTRIFGKLGITSRALLARAVERERIRRPATRAASRPDAWSAPRTPARRRAG